MAAFRLLERTAVIDEVSVDVRISLRTDHEARTASGEASHCKGLFCNFGVLQLLLRSRAVLHFFVIPDCSATFVKSRAVLQLVLRSRADLLKILGFLLTASRYPGLFCLRVKFPGHSRINGNIPGLFWNEPPERPLSFVL